MRIPAFAVCSLWATIAVVPILTSAMPCSAQTEQILYNFKGTDGSHPNGSLVFDAAGNLYGTTRQGGSGCASSGCGTAFELSPIAGGGWTHTTIHTFGGVHGETPMSGVILDATGNLYGTTQSGGAHNKGTVYELSPSSSGWTENVLYSFTGTSDGGTPTTGLVMDASGNLYGTNSVGGANKQGVAFELAKSGASWSETNLIDLYNLNGTGASPLVFDAAGNLYGTATNGGHNMNYQRGTVFELSPSSGGTWTAQVLAAFKGSATGGYYPVGGVVFDSAGNLYGTVSAGGGGDAFGGSIYELLASSWKEQILEVFTRFPASPHPPLSPIAVDSLGNLYVNVSGVGGGVCVGSVLRIGPSGGEEYLFKIDASDGHYPMGGPVLDAQNNLYGTTSQGGGFGFGTVFEVTFQ